MSLIVNINIASMNAQRSLISSSKVEKVSVIMLTLAMASSAVWMTAQATATLSRATRIQVASASFAIRAAIEMVFPMRLMIFPTMH